MNEVPQIATIADLRHRHLDVFAKLDQGAVVIAQHSRPAAVLVSVEEWNAHVKRLHKLELLLTHYQRRAQIERDPSASITHDELERQLAEKMTV